MIGEKPQAAKPQADLGVIGSLEIFRDGERIELPQSKKTRALLAYLAVTARPQRRERLCEMFWEVPDDPRGALRWSLSKLRPVLGDALEAEHETVTVNSAAVGLDYRRVRDTLSADSRDVSLT